MKKAIYIALSLIMIIALVSCAPKPEQENETTGKDVSITLSSSGSTLPIALTATITNAPENASYAWYMDGSKLENTTGTIITITDAFGSGDHEFVLKLISNNTVICSSDPIKVTIPETNTFDDISSGIKLENFKDNEAVTFKVDQSSQINLEGADIESLFVLEVENPDKAISKGMDVIGGNKTSRNEKSSGIYVVIPQEGGKVFISGEDLGITNEEGKTVKLKKIGKDVTLGSNYLEFPIHPTGFNYREQNYPEHLWPTYQHYYRLNLNDSKWSQYKDKKIAIMQYSFNTSNGAGGGRSQDNFGLIENGKVLYSGDIKGLYDLSDKQFLNVYTFLRTETYDGRNRNFRTYFLIPDVISVEADPFEIIGYPHIYQFNPTDKDKGYEIHIENIPHSEFSTLLTGLLQGRPRYIGETNNGYNSGTVLYTQSITNDADGYDVILYFEGMDEDFILNSIYRQVPKVENFGTISLKEVEKSDLIEKNDAGMGGTVTLDKDNFYKLLTYENPTDANLTVTIETTGNVRLYEMDSNSGGGSRTIKKGEPCIIDINKNTSGQFTLVLQGDSAEVTYNVSIKNR